MYWNYRSKKVTQLKEKKTKDVCANSSRECIPLPEAAAEAASNTWSAGQDSLRHGDEQLEYDWHEKFK